MPSADGSVESLGGAEEIDFEKLWQWPNASNGYALATPGGSGIVLAPAGGGIPLVSGTGTGMQPEIQAVAAAPQMDMQGIIDSSVQLLE